MEKSVMQVGKKSWRNRWLLSVLGLSVAVLLVAGCSTNSAPTPTTVSTTVQETANTTFTLAPLDTTTTTTVPNGVVGEIEFERVVEGVLVIGVTGAEELMGSIWLHPGYMIIDVRGSDEYAAGHIYDAVNIDATTSDFEKELSELPRESEYIIYGESEEQSAEVRVVMEDLGFESVADIMGGFDAWVKAGYAWTVEQ